MGMKKSGRPEASHRAIGDQAIGWIAVGGMAMGFIAIGRSIDRLGVFGWICARAFKLSAVERSAEWLAGVVPSAGSQSAVGRLAMLLKVAALSDITLEVAVPLDLTSMDPHGKIQKLFSFSPNGVGCSGAIPNKYIGCPFGSPPLLLP